MSKTTGRRCTAESRTKQIGLVISEQGMTEERMVVIIRIDACGDAATGSNNEDL